MKLIVALLTVASVAHADSVCEIVPIASPSGVKRVNSVTFPDGRQLIVVGHDHGDRKDAFGPLKLAFEKKTPESDRKLIRQLRRVVSNNRDSLADLKEDVQMLEGWLKPGSHFKFVGLEMDDDVTKDSVRLVSSYDWSVREHLAGHRLRNPRLGENAVLLMGGPYFRLLKLRPEIRERVRPFGFEGDDKGAYEKAKRDSDQATETLKKAIAGDERYEEQIIEKAWELNDLISDYTEERAFAIIEKTREITPPQYWNVVSPWLEAWFARIKAIHNRDRMSVQNLLATQESGISYIGRNHLKSIANKLRDACLAMLTPQTPAQAEPQPSVAR